MAVLYISEYEALPFINATTVPISQDPPFVEQTVAIGGASTQSTPFTTRTHVVRIHTDSVCSIKFGLAANLTTSPVTTSNKRLAANQTEYFYVKPSDSVAVIANT